MISPITDKVIKKLKRASLSLEDRTALLTAVMDKLHVLPLHDTLVIEPNAVHINGKALDMEQIISFRESAVVFKDNWARQIIHNQVRYLATNRGVYKSVSQDELYFYKAALWCLSEEDALLDKII